jgi:hypothetical protein
MKPRRPPTATKGSRQRKKGGPSLADLEAGCGEPGDIHAGDIVLVEDGDEPFVGLYDDDEPAEDGLGDDDAPDLAIVYPGKFKDSYVLVPRECCRRVSAVIAHDWWRRHWTGDFYGEGGSKNEGGIALQLGHPVPEDLIAADDLRDPGRVTRSIALALSGPAGPPPAPPAAPALRIIKGGRN